MKLIAQLKKNTGFSVILTNNIQKAYESVLEQIKLSRCANITSTNACNECISCNEFINKKYHYIFRIGKEREKQNISIEKIREYENYFYMKVENGYKKYFFIEEAETLSIEAQNHMLKILEEIPANTFFFFLCKNINNIIPTILSRGTKTFIKDNIDEDFGEDYKELKETYQYIVDFWYSQKKRDITLYEKLKDTILFKDNLDYEEKKTIMKFLLYKFGKKIMEDCKQNIYLLYIVEEILDFIMQLKYNITLELFVLHLYIKILKWKNIQSG